MLSYFLNLLKNMSGFSKKRIVNAKSLGDKLIEARVEQSINLAKAAKDLNIAYKYLDALEHNKLSDLPGRAYIEKFLKLYCNYLNLDFKECWRSAKDLKISDPKNIMGINKKHFLSWPHLVRRGVVILVILAILVFLGLKVQDIFIAPPLEISSPTNGMSTTAKQLEVVGQSEPEAEIIINNQNVFADSEGVFVAEVGLQKGLNLIKITAKKRYSRIREVEVRVLLLEE